MATGWDLLIKDGGRSGVEGKWPKGAGEADGAYNISLQRGKIAGRTALGAR